MEAMHGSFDLEPWRKSLDNVFSHLQQLQYVVRDSFLRMDVPLLIWAVIEAHKQIDAKVRQSWVNLYPKRSTLLQQRTQAHGNDHFLS